MDLKVHVFTKLHVPTQLHESELTRSQSYVQQMRTLTIDCAWSQKAYDNCYLYCDMFFVLHPAAHQVGVRLLIKKTRSTNHLCSASQAK